MKCVVLHALAAVALVLAADAGAAERGRKQPELTPAEKERALINTRRAEAAMLAGRLRTCGESGAIAQAEALDSDAKALAADARARGQLEQTLQAARAVLAACEKRHPPVRTPASVAAGPSTDVPRELAAAQSLLTSLQSCCARGAPLAACEADLPRLKAALESARAQLAKGDPAGARVARELTRELARAVARCGTARAPKASPKPSPASKRKR